MSLHCSEENHHPLLKIPLINRVVLFASKNVAHSFKLGTRVTKTWCEAIFEFQGSGIAFQMENFANILQQQKEQEAQLQKIRQEEREKERLKQLQQQQQQQSQTNNPNRPPPYQPHAPNYEQPTQLDRQINLVKRDRHANEYNNSFPHLLADIVLSDSAWCLDLFVTYNDRLKYLLFQDSLNEEVRPIFNSYFKLSNLPCFSGSASNPINCGLWPLLHAACLVNAKKVVASLLNHLQAYAAAEGAKVAAAQNKTSTSNDDDGDVTVENLATKREMEIISNYVNAGLPPTAVYFSGSVTSTSSRSAPRRQVRPAATTTTSTVTPHRFPPLTALQIACVRKNPAIVDFLLRRTKNQLNIFASVLTRRGKRIWQDAMEILVCESANTNDKDASECLKNILKHLEQILRQSQVDPSSELALRIHRQAEERFKSYMNPNSSYLCAAIAKGSSEVVKVMLSKFEIFTYFFEPRLSLMMVQQKKQQQQQSPFVHLQNVSFVPPPTAQEYHTVMSMSSDENNEKKEMVEAESKNNNTNQNDDDEEDDEEESDDEEDNDKNNNNNSDDSERKLIHTDFAKNVASKSDQIWSTNPLILAMRKHQSEIFKMLLDSKLFNLDGEPFTSTEPSLSEAHKRMLMKILEINKEKQQQQQVPSTSSASSSSSSSSPQSYNSLLHAQPRSISDQFFWQVSRFHGHSDFTTNPLLDFASDPAHSIDLSCFGPSNFITPTPLMFILQSKLSREKEMKRHAILIRDFLIPLLNAGASVTTASPYFGVGRENVLSGEAGFGEFPAHHRPKFGNNNNNNDDDDVDQDEDTDDSTKPKRKRDKVHKKPLSLYDVVNCDSQVPVAEETTSSSRTIAKITPLQYVLTSNATDVKASVKEQVQAAAKIQLKDTNSSTGAGTGNNNKNNNQKNNSKTNTNNSNKKNKK